MPGSSADGGLGRVVEEDVVVDDEMELVKEEGKTMVSEKDVKVVVGSVTVVIGISVVNGSFGTPLNIPVGGVEAEVDEGVTAFTVVVSLGGGINGGFELVGIALDVVATGGIVLLKLWRLGGGTTSSLGCWRYRKKLVVVVMAGPPY